MTTQLLSPSPVEPTEETAPTVLERLIAACDTDHVMPVTTSYGNPWSRGKGLVGPYHCGTSRRRYWGLNYWG